MTNIRQFVIQKHGRGDGLDDIRWDKACDIAREHHYHVERCFKVLIDLEDHGCVSMPTAKAPSGG